MAWRGWHRWCGVGWHGVDRVGMGALGWGLIGSCGVGWSGVRSVRVGLRVMGPGRVASRWVLSGEVGWERVVWERYMR